MNLTISTVNLILIVLLQSVSHAQVVVSPYNDINWDKVELKKTIYHVGHPQKWRFNPSSSEVIKTMAAYGYEIFGLSMDFAKDDRNPDYNIVWPWTNLSEVSAPEDPSEDVDPAELRVVAIPEAEHSYYYSESHSLGRHDVTVMFGDDLEVPGKYKSYEELHKLHPHDRMLYYENVMNSLTAFDHPIRYRYNVDYYIPFFDKTKNLLGISIFSKSSDREQKTSAPLWDSLLTHYANEEKIERFVWGLAIDDATVFEIGFRTPGRDITNHQGLFNNWMSQIWYNDEWDPVSQQDQSREKAREKFKNGEFFIHQAPYWAHTEQKPRDIPDVPLITNIEISENAIFIHAEGYDEIRWIREGEYVSSNATFEFSESDIGSYVRAELKNRNYGWTLTQPFYFIK